MKLAGLLITTLVGFLVLVVNVSFVVTGFGIASLIFNLLAAVALGALFLFYGPRRNAVLLRWLPLKARLTRPVLRSAVLFGCVYWFWLGVTQLRSPTCLDYGAPVAKRFVGQLLASICFNIGPVPMGVLVCVSALILAPYGWRLAGRLPNNSSKPTPLRGAA